MEIVEDLPYSLHVRDPDVFEKRLKRFSRKFDFFFNRDITKEGITKPRELLHLMFDVLEEKYPECPAWKYRGIYDDFIVYDPRDNSLTHRTRGHGLGMANSLTTLMQATIFDIIVSEFVDREFVVGEMDAIFLNDDASIGFSSENDFDSYLDIEEEVFARYNLLRKLSKSHKGPMMVFCENYYSIYASSINIKESYRRTEIFNIFAAQNITQAKMISGNLSKHVLLSHIDEFMDDIRKFWSYEFYPEEWRKPTLFGGWISPAIEGIRIDFEYYEETYNEMRAAISIIDTEGLRKKNKGSKNLYLDPIFSTYGELELPEEVMSRLNYCQPKAKVASKMARFSSKNAAEAAFQDLMKRRQEAFDKKLKSPLCIKEFYTYVYENFECKDFLPPKRLVEKFIRPTILSERRNYRSANPLLSLIKFYDPKKMPKRIVGERFSSLFSLNNLRPTVDERREIYRYIKYSRDTEISIYEHYTYRRYLFDEGHEMFLRPESIRAASETLWGTIGLPVITNLVKPRFESREVYLKKILFREDVGAIAENVLSRNITDEITPDECIKLSWRVYESVRKREVKKLSAPELPIVKEEVEPEKTLFQPDEYWSWKIENNEISHDPFSKDPVIQVFLRIESYIRREEEVEFVNSTKADRDGEKDFNEIIFDEFMQDYWVRSGGALTNDLKPVLRSTGIWDDDNEDGSSTGLGGFFE